MRIYPHNFAAFWLFIGFTVLAVQAWNEEIYGLTNMSWWNFAVLMITLTHPAIVWGLLAGLSLSMLFYQPTKEVKINE